MRINLLTENTISIKTSMTENNIDVSIVRSMFLQLYLAEEERHSRQKSYYQNLVMQRRSCDQNKNRPSDG